MRPRFIPPRPLTTDERKATGTRRRYPGSVDAPARSPDVNSDALLEQAEREGMLLARIAAYAENEKKLLARITEQESELEVLRARVDRLETALGDTLEKIAMNAIHESRTNPPNAGVSASDDRMPEDDDPTGSVITALVPPAPQPTTMPAPARPPQLASSPSLSPSTAPPVLLPISILEDVSDAPESSRPTPVPLSD